jgi:hypothetical protein
LPIGTPPIRDGWLTVHNGRVVGVGPGMHVGNGRDEDLGRVAVLPGLVNAPHPPRVVAFPRAGAGGRELRVVGAGGHRAAAEPVAAQCARHHGCHPQRDPRIAALRNGGGRDISNTLVTVRALADSALAAVVFYELIRFNTTDAQGVVDQAQRAIDAVPATAMVRASLAAHAPYFRRARRVSGDHARQRAASVQRAPGRVAGRGRIHSQRYQARGGPCSRSWAPGMLPGRRPAERRLSSSTDAGFWTIVSWPCTACR